MSRWKVSSNTVHNVGYHIIWCPKYRRKVLVGNVGSRIRDLLHEISAEIGVTIEKMEVMPEHLHLFASRNRCALHSATAQRANIKSFKIGISRAPLEATDALDKIILSSDDWPHF